MSSSLDELQPFPVWSKFATLCAIPHSSRHEAALREHLIEWALLHHIDVVVDGVGNLILKKPASFGCETMPGVILQGHLDMVCQANAGTIHNFELDPIDPVVRDGWVEAINTTLGADNGIGVALALAILVEPDLIHPSIEVLLTVNEESGMDGARGLKEGTLLGKSLINLDTEEWGYFYIGCAGGLDVEFHHDCQLQDLSTEVVIVRFDVSGLRGGHSGIDIHLGRGNAIKLIVEALRDLSVHTDVRLIELNGGTARNAIPREAYAVCALPVAVLSGIDIWVEHRLSVWQHRFAKADANVSFKYELDEMPVGQAIHQMDRDRLLTYLDIAANGVSQMSDDFVGVVDTSSNLGVVRLSRGEFNGTFKVRSLNDERSEVLADKLIEHAAGYAILAWKEGMYPAWSPKSDSKLLASCQQVYISKFSHLAGLQVIHAGLECGLLSASHPHLDMISFGPDIRGAHAPGERVEIGSVVCCWTLLKAVLLELATH